MALNPLENPLERLKFLPNAMNWRGGWVATEQYYLNDVVVSPVNLASYILAGKTALLNGGDPTANIDWVELSNTATGVLQVNAGIGLVNTNTPTIVDLENTGIITLASGNAGIGVVNGTGPPYPLNAVISNTGVLSVAAGNAGITVSAPTGAVTVSNSGILGITAGTGLSSTGGQTPTLSVSVPSPVLSFIAIPAFPSLGAINPMDSIVNAPANETGGLALFSIGRMADDFLNGAPDPNGVWLVDCSGFHFINISGQFSPPAALRLSIEDNTTIGGPYNYVFPDSAGIPLAIANAPLNGTGIGGGNAQPYGYGQIVWDVAAIRATGFRIIDRLYITNETTAIWWATTNPRRLFSVYYPNGFQ